LTRNENWTSDDSNAAVDPTPGEEVRRVTVRPSPEKTLEELIKAILKHLKSKGGY
jgi:hypothetical protein